MNRKAFNNNSIRVASTVWARGMILAFISMVLLSNCGRPEAASDIIFGTFVRQTIPDNLAEYDEPIPEKFEAKSSETEFSTVFSR